VRLPPKIAAAALPLLALLGCGDSAGEGACGPIRREALDPAFLVHVRPDEVVEYTSDPPTSGPHQSAPPVEGVVDEPLPRPIQVGVLEAGDVLLQHRPDLDADGLERLRALAGDRVVVAPNPDLPDPVVATAWVHKRTCASVDLAALEDFVDERVGKGPDDEGPPSD
jgi:hypothetical protein